MKDKKHGARTDEIDVLDINNPDVHHERSDLRIRPIVMFGVWLVVAAVIIHLAMAWLFDIFDEREKRIEGKQSPFATERPRIPPEPRLYLSPKGLGQPRPNLTEEHPFQEYRKWRAEQDARLNNYTWVDQNAGIVSIPIDEAKRLVLQRGLLVSRPAPVQSSTGTTSSPAGEQQSAREELPSDQSAGRQTEKRHP